MVYLLLLVLFASGCRRGGTDWRILKLYGGTTSVELLRHAPKVQAFRLAPPGAAPKPGEVHAGPYVASAAPVEIPVDVVAELSAILVDPETYDWRRVKRDAFRPQVGLWFVRGAYILEIALDLETAQITAYAGEQPMGAEDFDAARPRLLALVKRVFPNDAAIQSLR